MNESGDFPASNFLFQAAYPFIYILESTHQTPLYSAEILKKKITEFQCNLDIILRL